MAGEETTENPCSDRNLPPLNLLYIRRMFDRRCPLPGAFSEDKILSAEPGCMAGSNGMIPLTARLPDSNVSPLSYPSPTLASLPLWHVFSFQMHKGFGPGLVPFQPVYRHYGTTLFILFFNAIRTICRLLAVAVSYSSVVRFREQNQGYAGSFFRRRVSLLIIYIKSHFPF